MSVKKDENIHTSVLLEELTEAIETDHVTQNIIVDCTLGYAGHACEMIKKMKEGDTFVGFDADTRNLELAKERIENLQKQIPSLAGIRIVLIHSNFEHLKEKLLEQGIHSITGIYYDLGVSSLHFDEAERGFSLRQDGPLDMRFDTNEKVTAADIIASYSEKDLFQIFTEYGEEPMSRKIAAHICRERKVQKISTTKQLADIVGDVSRFPKSKTRIFQALRIEVNKELETLKKSLAHAIEMLEKDGNIFVISFHSLEDRITKHIFKKESKDCICSDIICSCKHTKQIRIISKKPILPSEEEMKYNSRSRSAKARHAKKL